MLPVMVSRLHLSLRKAGDPNAVAAWDIDHFTSAMATTTEPVALDVNRLSDARPEGTEATGQVEMTDMNLEVPYRKQPPVGT